MWVAIAMAAMAAIQQVQGAQKASTEADRINTVEGANAYAANLLRGARNELAGAKGRLARANQAENNNRILRAGGKAMEVHQVNYRRARDAETLSSFEDQIQFAEQAGAAVAAQAFSGVQGNVVDMVNGTTALRRARAESAQATRTKGVDFDASQRMADIWRTTTQSLDNSTLIDDLDYNVTLANTVQNQSGIGLGGVIEIGKAFVSGGGMSSMGGGSSFSGSGIQQSNARSGFTFRPSDNYGPGI